MTEAAAAAPTSPVRSPFAAGWGSALRQSLLAFAVVGLVAEGAALAVWAVGRTGLSLLTVLRVGGLYLEAFHRVPLRLSGVGLDVTELTAGQAALGAVRVELAAAPLAATALALWLLWRGGRAVARSVGASSGLAGALHGLKVAPAYAIGTLAVALLCRLRAPVPSWSIVRGTLELSASPPWALVLPLGLAAGAGAAGGWWAATSEPGWTPRIRFARAAVAAGAWMLALGLLLSYGGLLVLGVIRPDGPEALLTPSTGRYGRAVLARPGRGVVVLVHHLAVAPNEAVWTLVPAMGGCLGACPDRGAPYRFLCYRRFPRDVSVPAQLSAPPNTAASRVETRFGTAPMPYLLFLLVPALSTLLGGRFAVRGNGGTDPARRRAALGAAAGVVFAFLVLAVAWFASVSASGSVRLGEVLDVHGGVRVGPGLVGAGVLALAWGVLGGTAGALASGRRSRGRSSTS